MTVDTDNMRGGDFVSTFPAGSGPSLTDAEWMDRMNGRLRCLRVIVTLAILGAAAAVVLL